MKKYALLFFCLLLIFKIFTFKYTSTGLALNEFGESITSFTGLRTILKDATSGITNDERIYIKLKSRIIYENFKIIGSENIYKIYPYMRSKTSRVDEDTYYLISVFKNDIEILKKNKKIKLFNHGVSNYKEIKIIK